MNKLPNKPSALIRVAIEDLIKCEQDSRYDVNMGIWHGGTYRQGDLCSVCLAGAVMAQELEALPKDDLDPFDFKEINKLLALDAFRVGCISSGLNYMDTDAPPSIPITMEVSQYKSSNSYLKDRFKYDMLNMADMLEQAGI